MYDGYGAKGAGVRCEGYGGTVRGVRWYSTRGMVVRYEGYGGTAQGVQGYGTGGNGGTSGTVVRSEGCSSTAYDRYTVVRREGRSGIRCGVYI